MSSKPDLLDMLIATQPGGIEALERRGQREATRDFDRLPGGGHWRGNESDTALRTNLESLGFVFGERIDELFTAVTPPAGWSLRATDHAMWSDLLDPRGSIRGVMFYKAAFYDRDAHLTLKPRYTVLPEYQLGNDDRPNYAGPERFGVWDAETQRWVFRGDTWLSRPADPVLAASNRITVWETEDGRDVHPTRVILRENNRAYIVQEVPSYHGYTATQYVPVRKTYRNTSTPEENAAYELARAKHRDVLREYWHQQNVQQEAAALWLTEHFPDRDALAYWSPYS